MPELYRCGSGDETQVLTQARPALAILSLTVHSLAFQIPWDLLSSFQLYLTSPSSSAYKPPFVSPTLDMDFPSPTSI